MVRKRRMTDLVVATGPLEGKSLWHELLAEIRIMPPSQCRRSVGILAIDVRRTSGGVTPSGGSIWWQIGGQGDSGDPDPRGISNLLIPTPYPLIRIPSPAPLRFSTDFVAIQLCKADAVDWRASVTKART